jgi:hypothetical protein
MTSKIRSASSVRKMIATIKAGLSSGRVTRQNTLIGWTPSILALS